VGTTPPWQLPSPEQPDHALSALDDSTAPVCSCPWVLCCHAACRAQACKFCRRHPVLHYLLQVREAGSRAAQPSPPAVQLASQPVLALLGPGSRSLSGALPNRIGVVAPRANPAFRPSPSRPFLGVPWPPPPTPPRAFSQDVAGLLELLLARRRLVVRLSPRQPL